MRAILISGILLLTAFSSQPTRYEQDWFETLELIEKWVGESAVSYNMSNKIYAIKQNFGEVDGIAYRDEFRLKEETTQDGQPYAIDEYVFRFIDIEKIVDEGYNSYKGNFIYYSFKVDFVDGHHCQYQRQKVDREAEITTKSFVRVKCHNSRTYELIKTKFEEAWQMANHR